MAVKLAVDRLELFADRPGAHSTDVADGGSAQPAREKVQHVQVGRGQPGSFGAVALAGAGFGPYSEFVPRLLGRRQTGRDSDA